MCTAEKASDRPGRGAEHVGYRAALALSGVLMPTLANLRHRPYLWVVGPRQVTLIIQFLEEPHEEIRGIDALDYPASTLFHTSRHYLSRGLQPARTSAWAKAGSG